jgi:hypothetical protein
MLLAFTRAASCLPCPHFFLCSSLPTRRSDFFEFVLHDVNAVWMDGCVRFSSYLSCFTSFSHSLHSGELVFHPYPVIYFLDGWMDCILCALNWRFELGDVTFERRYGALPPIFHSHWNWGVSAFTKWARTLDTFMN